MDGQGTVVDETTLLRSVMGGRACSGTRCLSDGHAPPGTVFGGPSFFRIKLGVITDYSYNESYPYDDASFNATTTTAASVPKAGSMREGMLPSTSRDNSKSARRCRLRARPSNGRGVGSATQEVKAGGGQAGGGLRLRF
jgi:hypothetical protein